MNETLASIILILFLLIIFACLWMLHSCFNDLANYAENSFVEGLFIGIDILICIPLAFDILLIIAAVFYLFF